MPFGKLLAAARGFEKLGSVNSAAFGSFLKLIQTTRNWPALTAHRLGGSGASACEAALRDGTRVSLRPGKVDWYVFQEIFVVSVYQPAIEHLARFGQPAAVFDLGANLGYFSLRAAAVAPRLRVHAFEPGPPHLELIRRHLEMNPRLAQQIELHPEAVGGVDAVLRWNFDAANPGGSSLHIPQEQGTEVPVRRFASLVEAEPLPVALAKIDIEGSEYELVRETPPEVWKRISAIIIEVHHDPSGRETPEDLLSRLESFGYRSCTVHPNLYFLTR